LVEIQEFMSELEQAGQEFEEQNQELSLEFLEQRLFSLRALAKKHRCSPDDLPDFLLQLQVNLDAISNSDTSVKALEKEADLCKLTYKNKATDLSAKRKEVAHYLEKVIAQELPPLKLQAHLKVNFHSIPEDQWSEHGMETIEFFVSTNPGDPFGPLSKIASGGELSRIMLALKVVLNQKNQVSTLIFDEIDTGTGGSVADAMGKRLHGLAKNVQVLAVTHSPQVASYGDHHYFVSKVLEEGRMKTTIEELRDHSQKVEEIARMLSGSSITPQAKAAAEELLKD
jgi:DNA repair protein RecN (Recombination protein N)